MFNDDVCENLGVKRRVPSTSHLNVNLRLNTRLGYIFEGGFKIYNEQTTCENLQGRFRFCCA